ncbi:MAG: hypothetical protein R6W93_11015, partial [Candidatus Limnocylindrales bacterium]
VRSDMVTVVMPSCRIKSCPPSARNCCTAVWLSTYQPAQPLPAMSGWQVDSHTAVQQFLAEGGHDFMRQEGITTVTMSLRTDDPDGRITWLISAFAAQTNHSFTMNIDANSGGIIDIDHIQ